MLSINRLLLILTFTSLSAVCALAQWRATNGPGGSFVRAITSNGQNIIVGTSQNGIFLSSDNGANWRAINNGLTNFEINDIENSGDALYAATERAGVFKSVNGGESWAPINGGITHSSMRAVKSFGQTLFAGGIATDNGTLTGKLFRSNNGGQSWQEVLISGRSLETYSLSKIGTELFACGFGWCESTADMGATWKTLNVSNNFFASWITKVDRINGALYVSGLWAGIYRSDDNGNNWVRVNAQLPDPTVSDFVFFEEFLYLATDVGVYRKRLTETEWRWMPGGLQRGEMFAIATHNGKVFTGGIDGLLYINDTPKTYFVVTSAASYAVNQVSPGSIAAIFGSEMASQTAFAGTIPLPTTLANITVSLSSGTGSSVAPLFFVSPGQINLQIPSTSPTGLMTIKIINQLGEIKYSLVFIEPFSNGLFAANADGQGIAAAQLLRVKANNQQVYEPVASWDASKNQYVSRPIEIGAAPERDFLVLYGTGIRNAAPVCYIANQSVSTSYAGAVTGLAGLDQVNIPIGTTYKGRGNVLIRLETIRTSSGKKSVSNSVTVEFK